jgi:DNA-directed RNA polymerase subunit RPC12/RpoP
MLENEFEYEGCPNCKSKKIIKWRFFGEPWMLVEHHNRKEWLWSVDRERFEEMDYYECQDCGTKGKRNVD